LFGCSIKSPTTCKDHSSFIEHPTLQNRTAVVIRENNLFGKAVVESEPLETIARPKSYVKKAQALFFYLEGLRYSKRRFDRMRNKRLLMKTRLLKLSNYAAPLTKGSLLAICLALWATCPEAHAGDWANGPSHEIEPPQASYWSAMRLGTVIAQLPPGYVQVSAGTLGYYYYDGVYFRPVASLSSGYAVVTPPLGAIVPQAPSCAELVTVGDIDYYYAGGAFYEQKPTGFEVVPAPQGAVVNTLPLGASPVNFNGVVYYQASNGYFQPVLAGRLTLYTAVNP
jgi:hypothetical protein